MDNKKETKNELTKNEREKFVNQNNTISIANIQAHSVIAMKMITYGLYIIAKDFRLEKYNDIDLFEESNWVPEMWKDFTCYMPTSQFCEDLGIIDGGRQRILIEKAIDKIFEEKICIADEDKSEYFPWFVKATYYHPKGSNYKAQHVKEGDDFQIKLVFHPGIVKIALDNKKQYTHIRLKALGQLQSIYAIKWYEIILSCYNMKGRYGNAPDTWCTNSMTVDELKELFNIKPNLYKNRVNNLISRVLTKPIEEINQANLNFTVKIQFKRGFRNSIESFCLECKEICTPRIPSKNSTSEDKLVLEQKDALEEEINHYKTKYPEVFKQKLAEMNKDKGNVLTGFSCLQEADVCQIMKREGYF